MEKINKKTNIREAVETSIDLARNNKKGTWENINEEKRRNLVKWDDVIKNNFG